MKRTQLLTALLCFTGILALVLDSKTALTGAGTGLDLCIKTVIPSLFPFFFLSIYLTGILMGASLPVLRPLCALCGVSPGAEGILIAGFLGGYPVGAQAIGDAYRAGKLHRRDANRMLTFCSNAGPAFLFGIVGSLFPNPFAAFLLWIIHIASAILVSQTDFSKPDMRLSPPRETQVFAAAAMTTALKVTAAVCGWVILFRVLIEFLKRWVLWAVPEPLCTITAGFLELSNGCFSLLAVPDLSVRFILCSGMLAWGGLCVVMQTKSVIGDLSLGVYLRGKCLQTLFSLILSSAAVAGMGLPALCLLCLFAGFLRKRQKRDSIPELAGV